MRIPREIESQIQELVDGHLGEDQQKAIFKSIAADPELIRLYVSHTGLDLALKETMQFSTGRLAKTESAPSQRPQLVKALLASVAVVALSLVALRLVFVTEPPPLAIFHASPGTVYRIDRAEGKAPDGGSLSLYEGDRITLTQ